MAVPTIDVVSGQITGGPLNPGEPFQWINNTNAQVTLTNCGNFCTADSYTVPAAYGRTAWHHATRRFVKIPISTPVLLQIRLGMRPECRTSPIHPWLGEDNARKT